MVNPCVHIYNTKADLVSSIDNADIGSGFVIDASIILLNDQ